MTAESLMYGGELTSRCESCVLGKLTNGLAGVTTGATSASANETIALTAAGSEPSRPVIIRGFDTLRRTSAVCLVVLALGWQASALAFPLRWSVNESVFLARTSRR